jgi:hypothetical protein
MKNSIKIGAKKNQEKNRGEWCSLLVMMFGVLFSGSSAYFQIWKVRLCHMKNNNKIGKKTKTKKEW